MRYADSSCDNCQRVCEHNAISLEPILLVNFDKCSKCMLCGSACPVEALESQSQKSITQIVNNLKKHDQPVLACRYSTSLQAHVKTECLGWLSKEYILALCLNIKKPLRLNLTQCGQCKNKCIVDSLKNHIAELDDQFGTLVSDKMKLIENSEDLNYKPLMHSRRDFIKAFSRKTDTEKIDFNIDVLDTDSQKYAEKAIPIRRQLLSNMLEKCSPEIKDIITHNYFFDVQIDKKCDLCQECDSICPTESLAFVEENDGIVKLVFESSKCIKCGLCEDICENKLISVVSFSAENPMSIPKTLISNTNLTVEIND